MSFIKSSFSALGKLLFIGMLAVAFILGMAGVVYMSLQGQEVKVPEIVGKNFNESETELAAMGLKIKRRADRYSTESPNTILEQIPRPGETLKTGQMIFVVTSKPNADNGETTPVTLNKNANTETDDTEKIEEMISDKPKKPKANSNANVNKKKTRDVISNTSSSNGSSGTNSDSNSKDSGSNKDGDKGNKSTNPGDKLPGGGTKANTSRGTGGDVRPRTTPKP